MVLFIDEISGFHRVKIFLNKNSMRSIESNRIRDDRINNYINSTNFVIVCILKQDSSHLRASKGYR